MIKPTKRKGFNFFRSYYDVFNELPEKDRLPFITALFNKQFLGEDPTDLKGMAKFAWVSQQHSISEQVKGYETKTKTKLTPTVGVVSTPTAQVQEEEEEKGEYTPKGEGVLTEKGEATPINYINLLAFFNTKRSEKLPKSKGISVISDNVKDQYKKRIKEGYDKQQIAWSIENAFNDKFFADNNYKHLTIGYFSRANTLDLYGTEPTQTKKDKELWDW
jgi:hypothetical protein